MWVREKIIWAVRHQVSLRSALHGTIGHRVLISGRCIYLSDCADEHVDIEPLCLHMPVRPFLLTGAFSFSGISANSLMNEVPFYTPEGSYYVMTQAVRPSVRSSVSKFL